MTNIINFRPLFFSFVAFGVGIAFSYYIFSFNVLFIALILSAVLALFVFALLRKKLKNFLLIFLVFMLGLGFFYVGVERFTGDRLDGRLCTVSGYISDNLSEKSSMIYVTLRNATLDGKNTRDISLEVYQTDKSFSLKTGDFVAFNANVYSHLLFENGTFNSYAYKNNTPYYCYVTSNDISVFEGFTTFGEEARKTVKNLLLLHMPEESANLSYSILFGDKTDLEQEIKNSFSTSGIAHLLAVSGLHVGFLVAMLYFVLKRVGCKELPKFFIIAGFLLFYLYLCNFSASVMRATIMCLVFLLIKLIGKQPDLINSIAIAGLIILLLKPLYIFDAGFIMSFASVMAIAMLYKPVSRFLTNKVKIPQKISDALAIDFCTTLAILPVIATYFGKISAFSWLTNLITIPVFTFAYSALLVCVIIALILPFMSFVLYLPHYLLSFVVFCASIVAGWKFAIIELLSFSAEWFVAFYLVLFLISACFMVSNIKKLASVFMVMVMCSVVSLGFHGPVEPNSFTYTQLNTRKPCAVLTSISGEIMVIGNEDLVYTNEYLKYKSYNHVDVLVVTNPERRVECYDFVEKYNIKTIVEMGDGLRPYGSFGLKFINLNGHLKAIFVDIGGVGCLVAVDNIGSNQAKTIKKDISNLNVKVLYQSNYEKHFEKVQDFQYVFSKYYINDRPNYLATSNMGTFAFSVNNGIIENIRSESWLNQNF